MVDMLITEVNDALRKDKWQAFWQNNKNMIFMAVIAIVLGTAGGQVYRHMKKDRDATFTGSIFAAQQLLQKNDAKAAVTLLLPVANDAKGAQREFAFVWLARAQLATQDNEAARATLESLVAQGKVDSMWRDTACVWLMGMSDDAVKGCDATKVSPLQPMKLELAAASALQAGKPEQARGLLGQLLASKNVSPQQRARAKQLQLLLPPKTDEVKK